MIHAGTAAAGQTRREAFVKKWRLRCIRHCRSDQWRDMAHRSRQPRRGRGPAVHLHQPATQAMEIGACHESHRAPERRVPPPLSTTEAVLPCAETVPKLFWDLLASGRIEMRKVDGWQTLGQTVAPMPLDQAA